MLEMCLVFFFANMVEIWAGSYVGDPTWRLAHLLWSSVLKRWEARSPPLYPPNPPSTDYLFSSFILRNFLKNQPTRNRAVFQTALGNWGPGKNGDLGPMWRLGPQGPDCHPVSAWRRSGPQSPGPRSPGPQSPRTRLLDLCAIELDL